MKRLGKIYGASEVFVSESPLEDAAWDLMDTIHDLSGKCFDILEFEAIKQSLSKYAGSYICDVTEKLEHARKAKQ